MNQCNAIPGPWDWSGIWRVFSAAGKGVGRDVGWRKFTQHVKQDMDISLLSFWRKVLAGLWQLQDRILKSWMTEHFNASLHLARFTHTSPVSDMYNSSTEHPPRGLEESLFCNVASQSENVKLYFSASLSGLWSWLLHRAVQTCVTRFVWLFWFSQLPLQGCVTPLHQVVEVPLQTSFASYLRWKPWQTLIKMKKLKDRSEIQLLSQV